MQKIISQIKNNRSAFTLIEMVIVIFIIGIILSIVSLNYGEIHKGSKFEGTILKLVSDTRKAQNFTMGLKEFEGEFPEGGWGINFDNNTNMYALFADIGIIDGIMTGPAERFGEENEIISGIINFDNIYIFSFKDDGEVSDCISDKDNVHIIYKPPNPDIQVCYNDSGVFCEGSLSNPLAGVVLEFSAQDGKTMCVLINQFGLVDLLDDCTNFCNP